MSWSRSPERVFLGEHNNGFPLIQLIQAGALSMQDESTSDIMPVVPFALDGRVAVSSTVFVFIVL